MEKSEVGHFCEIINRTLANLSFNFERDDDGQALELVGGRKIKFPDNAGGGVAGGSAAWIDSKHKNGGLHEPGLIAALFAISEVYSDIRCVFDVGALYGYFSLVGKSIFSESEIHAFEVNANSYRALKNNIDANAGWLGSDVIPHHCAMSDLTEKGARVRVRKFSVDSIEKASNSHGERSGCTMDVWTMDDFCRELGVQPDIMKIDVEGYQAKIIPGAMDVISQCRPIVLLEFDDQEAVNSCGVTNKEIIEPLSNLGYRLIWGCHRNRGATFRVIQWADLSVQHEINSLGILVP